MDPDITENIASRKLRNPRLEIGGAVFPEECMREAEIRFEGDEHVRSRSAYVVLTPPAELRWDFKEEAKLYEDGDIILTGLCTKAKIGKDGTLHLSLYGPFWKLNRTSIESLETFGMSNKENMHWLVKLTDPSMNTQISGLQLNTTTRPFMYTIPLQGLSNIQKTLFLTSDTFIAPGSNDDTSKQILGGSESIKGVQAWEEHNTRIFGIVFAEDFLEAERLALERAHLMVGILNLGVGTGMSHFETRYDCEPLTFDAENTLTPASLHPWIIIREVTELKGWIRNNSTAVMEPENTTDDSLERIQFFLSNFLETSKSGDMHDQLGRRQASDREEKLMTGTKRAFRWLDIASGEEDLKDQFAATWIALESVLNSVKYPGVFQGKRAGIKAAVLENLRKITLPEETNTMLTVDAEMLISGALRSQWSSRRKLDMFAKAFGIKISPDDKTLVSKLGRARATVFHEGQDNPDISTKQLIQLRSLVERLIAATSIGGYEDLEGGPYKFQFGEIGPEGGAAPLSIDGKDVLYDFRMFRDSTETLVAEWIADGKIYNDRDIIIEHQTEDHTRDDRTDEANRPHQCL